MTTFDRALAFVLDHEGGATLTTDTHDPGGTTRYGISQRAYPHEDIINLTEARAREIYQRDYWAPLYCADYGWPLALALFDTAVNCGVKTAVRLGQKAAGVEIDGVVGPKTRATWQASPRRVARALLVERATYYSGLPTVARYGRGWFGRVLDCALAGAS